MSEFIASVTDLTPSRPKTDKKEYKLAVLSSGMKVLVVSSGGGSRDRAAASMTVNVGSFSDPPEVEGLAHYLEHMVFMGSEKYPEENRYDAFVDSHGGFCNAFTEGEYTNYVFDISGESLPEAFDIFANCFIAPKLSITSSDRELQAIDSEFHLAEMSDAARAQEVLCSCANDGHFYRKFSWGNLKSLKDEPISKGVDPNEKLRAFYETFYTPDNMCLVVISPRSTEEMLYMVEKSFGSWKPVAATAPLPKDTHSGYPFMGKPPAVTRFQSVKNIHRLEIHWVIPVCNEALHYRYKADQYIAHLLGHEGAGSVLSNLKARGYATEMCAGIGEGNFTKNTKFSIFEVSVSLTAAGLANWIDVVGMIYSYLQLIEGKGKGGPPQWVFNEIKNMAQYEYDYCDEEDEDEFVEELAVKMALFSANDPALELLPSDDLYLEWDPDGVLDVLAALAPCNSFMQLMSPVFKNTPLCRSEVDESISNEDEEEEEDDDEMDTDGSSDDSDEGSDSDESGSDSEDSDANSSTENISVPSLEELSGLYKGDNKWRYLADPAAYIARSGETGDGVMLHRTEPNFGTKYWYDEIPSDLLGAWDSWCDSGDIDRRYDPESAQAPYEYSLHLPAVNPFIPSPDSMAGCGGPKTEDVESVDGGEIPQYMKEPSINHRLAVYNYADRENQWTDIPKVVLLLKFSSGIVAKNIHHHVANDLIGLLLMDALNETAYMAMMAGVTCSIESDDFGFTLAVAGFRDKLDIILPQILDTIFSDDSLFLRAERLDTQVELLFRRYSNEGVKAGGAASQARKLALMPSHFAGKLCEQVLSIYSQHPDRRDQLKLFMDQFLQECVVDFLIHGRFPDSAVYEIIRQLSARLDTWDLKRTAPALAELERRIIPVAKLPSQSVHILRTSPRSPTEKNICVEVYFQAVGCDVRTISNLDILEQMLSEPFFNELRTKKQLGYSVSCETKLTYDTPGICFTVVSSSFSINEVQNEIFDFIKGIPDFLLSQGEDSYGEHINSLLNEKKTPDVSLRDQATRFWSEIVDRRLNFKWKQNQIVFFKNPPQLSEVVAFGSNLLVPSATSNVRMIVVQCSSDFSSTTAADPEHLSHDFFSPLTGAVKFSQNPAELHEYAHSWRRGEEEQQL